MSAERLHHQCGGVVDHEQCEIGITYHALFFQPGSNRQIHFCPSCGGHLYQALVNGELSLQAPAIAGKELL